MRLSHSHMRSYVRTYVTRVPVELACWLTQEQCGVSQGSQRQALWLSQASSVAAIYLKGALHYGILVSLVASVGGCGSVTAFRTDSRLVHAVRCCSMMGKVFVRMRKPSLDSNLELCREHVEEFGCVKNLKLLCMDYFIIFNFLPVSVSVLQFCACLRALFYFIFYFILLNILLSILLSLSFTRVIIMTLS